MASMATMDYYSIYGALLQTPVEGPGFADVGAPSSVATGSVLSRKPLSRTVTLSQPSRVSAPC